MRRIFRRPSPAMAVAFIALLAGLSGTAVALPGKNTVDSGDIKKGAVKRSDIANNAVNSAKVANNSLRLTDFRASDRSQLVGPQGPQGSQGPQGPQGPQGNPGADATALWAVINSDGTLARGENVESAQKLATGQYEVIFNVSVENCAYQATIGDAGGGTVYGEVSAVRRNPGIVGHTRGVFVKTRTSDGVTDTDKPYHLAVFC
jgi:hypothetical protein